MVKRYDVTTHAQLVKEIRKKTNITALYPLSETDIVKIAIERLYKDAFPEKDLPQLDRKRYYELPF